MKILVLSDSHSAVGFMQDCIEFVKPDAVIHLGDYVRDCDFLRSEYPDLRFFQVAGNCDRNRVAPVFPEILLETFQGKRIMMTHGHLHGVKIHTAKLIADAERSKADVVLYGHTHEPDCRQLDSGLWILNPGSCGYYGGTAGIVLLRDDSITCSIIRRADLGGVK